MKTKLLLILIMIFNFCIAQEKPIITFASQNNVVGFSEFKSIVVAKYKDKVTGNDVIDTTLVKSDNKFKLKFTKAPLDVGTSIIVYNEKRQNDTLNPKVKSDSEIVTKLTKKSTDSQLNYFKQQVQLNAYEAEKEALKNTTLVYKTTILSTNFSVPLVRFNFVKGDENKQGDILLFNSIGAGLGYYKGRLERTRDNTGEIVNEDFSNTIGINVGFLFSAGTGEDTKNVFAPVFNISVLDIQLGIGCELGTRAPNQKKEFLTLSYAIPLYKLFRKGYRVYLSSNLPFESIHKTQN